MFKQTTWLWKCKLKLKRTLLKHPFREIISKNLLNQLISGIRRIVFFKLFLSQIETKIFTQNVANHVPYSAFWIFQIHSTVF